jgi:PAS domain S-box-containing protein
LVGSPLTRRLIAVMASLAVAPVVVGLVVGYGQARRALREEAFSHLESLASAKAQGIEMALSERQGDAVAVALRPWVRRDAVVLVAGADAAAAAAARTDLLRSLKLVLQVYEQYSGAVLVAPGSGRVLASAGSLGPQAVAQMALEAARLGRVTVGRPVMTDVCLDPERKRPVLDVLAAVPTPERDDPQAPVVALLVLRVDLDHGIYPFLDDRTGMGQTGEIVLVNENGLVIKDLRHDPKALLNKTLSALPAYRAARGQTGAVEALDYRGVPVLAAHRPIESAHWGLVVKEDRREAFALLGRLAWGFTALALVAAGVAAATAYWLACDTAAPIVELARAAERLAAGDLGARVATRNHDEIGTLSSGFNRMAERVSAAQTRLESVVEERTAELRRTYEQLELVLSSAQVTTWETMLTSGEFRFSDSWAAMLGYAPGELPFRTDTFWSRVHPDDRPMVTEARNAHLDGRRSHYEAEFRMQHRDGEWRWVYARGHVVERDECGQPLRVMGVSIDVTDRRALEERITRSSRLESIGTLAGGVAHDFNNLLTGIGGFAELARDAVADRADVVDDLTQVMELSGRAAALTRQLLAFSRRQTLEPSVLNVNDLVANMAKLLARLLGETVRLDFVPEADLGSTYADPAQIEQVVMNLAVNARDAMPEGGNLTVETQNVVLDRAYAATHTEVTDGPYVMIAVTDTGQGMDSATLERIFEPFFTTKAPGHGTGLGLSVVHGIVKQHNGHITCYSEAGKGTTFKVYLPRVDATAAEAAAEPLRDLRARHAEQLLLVEDEEHVRRVAQRMLETAGYTVLPAGTRAEAEALFAEHAAQIALLVTDVVMPEGSGKDLFLRLSERRPDLRVLYMSGYTVNAIAHHGVLDPGTHFLQKPFTPEAIARKVREALGEDDA